MELASLVVGGVFLVLGRKLFWFFVGMVGFLVGMEFAGLMRTDIPEWMLLVLALGAGMIGAMTAIFAERIAFAVAGFYAGAYVLLLGARTFGAVDGSTVAFVVGGVMGAVVAAYVVDWALFCSPVSWARR